MADLKFLKLDTVVDTKNINEGALNVVKILRPSWALNNIKFEIFSNGKTNHVMRIDHDDEDSTANDTILIRVYGNNSDLIIDHTYERKVMQLLYPVGLSSKLYASFTNGLAYKYLPGEVLDEKSCYDDQIFPLVAKKMAKFHLQLPNYMKSFAIKEAKPCLWDKISTFLGGHQHSEHLEKEITNCQQTEHQRCDLNELSSSLESLNKELQWLIGYLEIFGNPVVFCHNDLLLGNILHDVLNKTVHFIDFEYAGPNYQAYDIANYFNEFSGSNSDQPWSSYPNENFRREWIRTYFKEYDSSDEVDESKLTDFLNVVEHFRLASHFFCGTWGLYQLSNSTLNVDFKKYSALRLGEYYRVKRILLGSNL